MRSRVPDMTLRRFESQGLRRSFLSRSLHVSSSHRPRLNFNTHHSNASFRSKLTCLLPPGHRSESMLQMWRSSSLSLVAVWVPLPINSTHAWTKSHGAVKDPGWSQPKRHTVPFMTRQSALRTSGLVLLVEPWVAGLFVIKANGLLLCPGVGASWPIKSGKLCPRRQGWLLPERSAQVWAAEAC